MARISPVQPYCRCCGKAIKKYTVTHSFGHSRPGASSWLVQHVETATTKAEAQRYTNHKIVSVHRGFGGNITVTTWDSESYIDALFCTERCAASFGRMAAEYYPDMQTQAATNAEVKRRAK